MDGLVYVKDRLDGWIDKCKFEIVLVVSQMYGWMEGWIDGWIV